VPTRVRVEGEGGGGEGGRGSLTNLVAPGGATAQDMFKLSANASLEGVRITVPANAGGAPGGAGVVQLLGAGARFAHSHIDMSGAAQRNTALAVSTGTGVVDVTDMVVDSVDVDLPTVVSTGAIPYVAVVLGFTGQDCTGNTTEPIVRNVRTTGGQGGVWMLNIFGGVVDGLRSTNMLLSTTTLGVWWDAGGSALTTLQGPTILNPSLVIGTGSGSIDITAIKVSSSYTGGASLTVTGTRIVAPFVRFTDVTTVGARVAIKIRIETNGTAQLVKGSISGGTSIGHEIGVLYSTRTANNAANTVGAVNDWTCTGFVATNPISIGPATPCGAMFEITTSTAAKINRCGVVGCDFSGAPATGYGVIINTHVTNSMVVANQLTPSGGTAYSDSGTGSQIGQNIV